MSLNADDASVFRTVTTMDEMAPGSVKGFVVEGWPVLVARLADSRVFAILDRCSHAAARLSNGRIRRTAITCPVHSALFDLATGRCVGEAYRPILSFPLRITDDVIEVAIPTHPPAPDQLPVFTVGDA